jgi:prophage DNA circulation protein
MAASWRDKLRPASFRGVSFEVATRQYAGGRRVATHEYPKRDEPSNEDMGRKARQLSVEAFQFGPEYLGPRNALLEALEQAGPGEYVDPWGLSHSVVVRSFSASERLDMGGYVAWRIDFAEDAAGGHASRADTAALTASAADNAGTVYVEEFPEYFTVQNVPDQVRYDALNDVEGWLGRCAGFSLTTPAALRSVLNIRRQAVSLLDKPQQLAHSIFGIVGSLLEGIGSANPKSRYAAARDIAALAPARPDASVAPSPSTANRAALSDITSGLALVQAARATSEMDFDVYDDAVAVRLQVADDLDSAMASASDPLYETLHALRTAVVRDISSRGANLARLADLQTTATLPALVVAYGYYGDASKETEVLSRNPVIRHPGFVPGGSTLKVKRYE